MGGCCFFLRRSLNCWARGWRLLHVLRACEASVQRLATDRHYFANPARTLFTDIRAYFPMIVQVRVLRVIERYLGFADEFLRQLPQNGFDAYGNPLQCRASTRKGTPCQRIATPSRCGGSAVRPEPPMSIQAVTTRSSGNSPS